MGRLAIVAAMPQELQTLLDAMPDESRVQRAGRDFWVGHWEGRELVAVLSGIGKVAAAITTTLLLTEFEAQAVVFVGVAGGLGAGVQVGDAVVATELLQHDMDASPLFPRHQIPGLGKSRLPTDPALSGAVCAAAREALSHASGHARVC